MRRGTETNERPVPLLTAAASSTDSGTADSTNSRPDGVIAAAAAQKFAQSPGSDRRNYPRRGGTCLVTLAPIGDYPYVSMQQRTWVLHASKLKGMLIDISLGGVAFLLPCKIEPETEAFLRICNYRFGTNLDTSGIVLRHEKHDESSWKIVCQFDYNLTVDQLNTLSHQLSSHDFIGFA